MKQLQLVATHGIGNQIVHQFFRDLGLGIQRVVEILVSCDQDKRRHLKSLA